MKKQAQSWGNKKLGDSYVTVDNQEYGELGYVWTGNILFGETYEAMKLVFDTASDWLVIQGSDCTNCEGKTYDIGPSIAKGSGRQLSDGQSLERSIGNINFQGKEYSETVCIFQG